MNNIKEEIIITINNEFRSDFYYGELLNIIDAIWKDPRLNMISQINATVDEDLIIKYNGNPLVPII